MTLWQPWYLTPRNLRQNNSPDPDFIYAVVILNQPIESKKQLLDICKSASFIACADGGANRLKDLCLEGQEADTCQPNVICGDLDSLLPEVREYYESKGCQIVEDSSQDSTDVTKCLKQIESQNEAILSTITQKQVNVSKGFYQSHVDVVLLGGLGGRIDQAFSILHHLYKPSEENTLNYRLFLVSPQSIAFVLTKGYNHIIAPDGLFCSRASVGIIPIGRPAIISTRGFKWDVEDWPTEFGTQISTSNYAIEDFVDVITTERVLFTIEISQIGDK